MKHVRSFDNHHLTHSHDEYFRRREAALKSGEEFDAIGTAQEIEDRNKLVAQTPESDLQNAIKTALANYKGDLDKAKKIVIDTINAL